MNYQQGRDEYYGSTYYVQHYPPHIVPVVFSSAPVYGGHYGMHPHIDYGHWNEAPNVQCDRRQSRPSSSRSSSSRSSAFVVRVQQQAKGDKSANASIIGLPIDTEEFLSRERDFQRPLYESMSMEVAHKACVSRAVRRGDVDPVLAAGHQGIHAIEPDVILRAAFHHEGSKALQGIIMEPGTSSAVERIYESLSKDILHVCLDTYGNYTVQCLIKEASSTVASHLGDVIVSYVLPLSLNFYGCRVVQCALKHLPMEYTSRICDAIEPYALHCLQSQNANHVVNAILELCRTDRPAHATRIHASICHHSLVLATHKYGVTVLNTALESNIAQDVSKAATMRLLGSLNELCYDEYGNYLMQSLIKANLFGTHRAVHEFLLQSALLTLSCDKFGSNVFETWLLKSGPEQTDEVVMAFLKQCQVSEQADEIVTNIAVNKYGNYVVQRMLAASSLRVGRMLSTHLAPQRALIIESKHGRHIAKQLIQ